MNGNTYSEKLWIHERLRNKISEKDMKTNISVGNSIITLKKKIEPEYVIRTDTYKFRRNTL